MRIAQVAAATCLILINAGVRAQSAEPAGVDARFSEPLQDGTYTGTGRNPYTAHANAERNGAYGPGLFQVDLRLGYRGHPGGRTVDLFADVFNITNRANFDNPIGDRRSTDFLRLTTLRPGAVPTTVQLGVRYEF